MNIKLLNKIWNGIKDGTYEHYQQKYHCGSAHCIAGWIETLDTKEGYYDGPYWMGQGCSNPILKGLSTYEYAKTKLDINCEEAKMLFSATASDGEIQEIVDKFQSGQRIVWGSWCDGRKWAIVGTIIYIKVDRNYTVEDMRQKIREIWQGEYRYATMFMGILAGRFEKCIVAELP